MTALATDRPARTCRMPIPLRGHPQCRRRTQGCRCRPYAAGVSFELAQVNVSRLLAPIDSPVLADFMAPLDEVNAAGDAAPGFRWRLQTEDGNATAVRAFGWDAGDSHGVIVNLTTWDSVEALGDFVFSGQHLQIMGGRRSGFSVQSSPQRRCGGRLRATGRPPTTPRPASGTYVGTDPPGRPSPSGQPSTTPPRPPLKRTEATTGSARPGATRIPQQEPQPQCGTAVIAADCRPRVIRRRGVPLPVGCRSR